MNITKKVFIAAFLLASIFLPSSAYAQSFDKNLYYGLQGDAGVTELQEFLADQGVYSGPITGNFFSLTLKAVKQFQVREGITPAAGYFGPLTRARANTLLSSQVQPSEQQAISETGSAAPTPTAPKTTNDVFNSLQQQIALLLQQVALLQQQLSTQQQTQQIIQQQQSTLQQIQQNTQPVPQSNPNVDNLLILESKINQKSSSYKNLADIFKEVTPYQSESCKNEWLGLKQARLGINVFTKEGLEQASSTGRFDNTYEDSRYQDCLHPGSTYYKTSEQLKAYKELKPLEEEINNMLIPQYKLICEGLLSGAIKWITSVRISCSY